MVNHRRDGAMSSCEEEMHIILASTRRLKWNCSRRQRLFRRHWLQGSLLCSAHGDRRAAGEMSVDIISGTEGCFTARFIERPATAPVPSRCRIRLRPEIIGIAARSPSFASTLTHELTSGRSIVSRRAGVDIEAKNQDGNHASPDNGLSAPGHTFSNGDFHDRSPGLYRDVPRARCPAVLKMPLINILE